MKNTIRSIFSAGLFTLLLLFTTMPRAYAIDPVQEGQKVLNGNGVETYLWTMLGTAPVGAGAPTSGQQQAFQAAAGLPPTTFVSASLNQVLQYNGTIFAPSSNTLTFFDSSAPGTPLALPATTRTYMAGSAIGPFTANQLKVGTTIRWHFQLVKTGAGTATSVFDIAFGTAGTTADTAQVSFTKPAGTAAADTAWVDIECQIQTIGTSGVAVGTFRLIHNLAATGFSVLPGVVLTTTSSTFSTATPTYVGLCATIGTGETVTMGQVSAEAINL